MKKSLQYIQDLDLHYLVLRLVNKYNWDAEEAREAVRKYKNFLTLKALHPKLVLVPTPEIDEVWHNHILHTQKYTRDCEQVFNYYMHHIPASSEEEEQQVLKRHYKIIALLYENTFQEPYGHALDITLWQEEIVDSSFP